MDAPIHNDRLQDANKRTVDPRRMPVQAPGEFWRGGPGGGGGELHDAGSTAPPNPSAIASCRSSRARGACAPTSGPPRVRVSPSTPESVLACRGLWGPKPTVFRLRLLHAALLRGHVPCDVQPRIRRQSLRGLRPRWSMDVRQPVHARYVVPRCSGAAPLRRTDSARENTRDRSRPAREHAPLFRLRGCGTGRRCVCRRRPCGRDVRKTFHTAGGGGGGNNQHSPNTPTTGLRERGNDTSRSTGRSGRQNAATQRNMRREERVTVQGPVKKQQPDGMSHRGVQPGMYWNGHTPQEEGGYPPFPLLMFEADSQQFASAPRGFTRKNVRTIGGPWEEGCPSQSPLPPSTDPPSPPSHTSPGSATNAVLFFFAQQTAQSKVSCALKAHMAVCMDGWVSRAMCMALGMTLLHRWMVFGGNILGVVRTPYARPFPLHSSQSTVYLRGSVGPLSLCPTLRSVPPSNPPVMSVDRAPSDQWGRWGPLWRAMRRCVSVDVCATVFRGI